MRKRLASNDEVCHYWANQVQEDGHVENLYFIERELYSYGSHFLLAKIYDHITLINSESYSVSTQQHKSLAIRALGYQDYIEVPYPNPTNVYCHEDNVKYLIEKMNHHLKKSTRARTYKDMHLKDAKGYSDNAHKYAELFNVTIALPPREFSGNLLAEIKEAEQREAKRKREQIKLKKERLKDESIEAVTKFRGMGVIPRRDILNLLGTDLARIKDNEVITTQNAKVPLTHVKRLFLALDNGLDVSGKSLGPYKVSSYSNDVLKVGCHKFNKDEVNNMRKLIKGSQS